MRIRVLRAVALRGAGGVRAAGDRPMRAGGLEVALAGALLGSFLTIPVGWAHLSFGVAFAVLALAHIGRRRRVYLAVLLRRRRRAVVSAVLVASAVVMTVSGVVQWAGVTAAIPWHGASSMLLILLGAGHAIRRIRGNAAHLHPLLRRVRADG